MPFQSSLICIVIGFCWQVVLSAQEVEPKYPVPIEAQVREGVPQGRVEGPFSLASEIFPGTQRQFWIYVPAQYKADQAACTMIVQDGLNRAKGWRLPQILDSLIAAKEMPVTIGIFVTPGVVAGSEGQQPRYNRSYEYDSRGDLYARFLLEELIPRVSDKYNLSTNPNDRALAGASSGGICAFNAAWERPDAFRRVLSTIGTFVGLRGANEFPVLVRKFEPRPLRVFLQDGSSDLNIYPGDWWVANQAMLSSLKWAGYEVANEWGVGGHNAKHAAAIMPDALRWLWKDHPQPVRVDMSRAAGRRTDLLIQDEGWNAISSGHQSLSGLVCSSLGEPYFSDSAAGRIYRIASDQKTRVFSENSGSVRCVAFDKLGNLFAVDAEKRLSIFGTTAKKKALAGEFDFDRMCAVSNGMLLANSRKSTVAFYGRDGMLKSIGDAGVPVSAMVATPDEAFFHIGSSKSSTTVHAQFAKNFQITNKQSLGYLHTPYLSGSSGVSAMTADSQGRIFIASELGIQIMDQLGRVHLILQKPSPNPIVGLALGGPEWNCLYAADSESVYVRKLNVKGVFSPKGPVALPKPRL